MNKKKIVAILVAGCIGAGLTGCEFSLEDLKGNTTSDGFGQTETKEETVEVAVANSENEEQIISLLGKRNAEGLSEEEYVQLASLCEAEGYIKDERDALEDAYRLFGNGEYLETLQNLSVNLDEESEEIQQLANDMKSLFEMGDAGMGEELSLLSGEATLRTLMPKLAEGVRTYFMQENGAVTFILKAGYENGEPMIAVSGPAVLNMSDAQVPQSDSAENALNNENTEIDESSMVSVEANSRLIQRNGSKIVLFEELSDSTGAFRKSTFDMNGEIRIEEGTIQNACMVGDYTIRVASFDSYNDTFSSIYEKKDKLNFTEFQGKFDENGKSIMAQPSEQTRLMLAAKKGTTAVIVYAYSADKTQCLYEGVSSEEAAGFSFGKSFVGIEIPKIEKNYTAKTALWKAEENQKENAKQLQIEVKVVDGKVLVNDGNGWEDYGNVEEYVNQDPFHAYEQNNEEKKSEGSVTYVKTSSSSSTSKMASLGDEMMNVDVFAGNENSQQVSAATTTPQTQQSQPTKQASTSTQPAKQTTPAPTPTKQTQQSQPSQQPSQPTQQPSQPSEPSQPSQPSQPSEPSNPEPQPSGGAGGNTSGGDTGGGDTGGGDTGGGTTSGDAEDVSWTDFVD